MNYFENIVSCFNEGSGRGEGRARGAQERSRITA